MPGHIVTDEQYNRLIEAFRTAPSHYSEAGRAAGISAHTARKCFHEGYPKYGKKAIADILREEQEHARAKLAEMEAQAERTAIELDALRKADAKLKAVDDVTESRVQEAQMIRMGRSAATNLLMVLTNLSKGTTRIGERIQRTLEAMGSDETPLSPLEVTNMTRLVSNLSLALRQTHEAASRAMEMERLLLGEPSKIVGITHLEDVTVDEAQRRIDAANRALARAKGKPTDGSQPAMTGLELVVEGTESKDVLH